MKRFIYLIGTMDDFESIEDLKAEYFNNPSGTEPVYRNMSVYPVELSEGCIAKGYNDLEEIAIMIARGEAMSTGWCLDDTLSILLEA